MLGYTLIKTSTFQAIRDTLVRLEKANKIARKMTDEEIDDVLAGKIHLHRNPGKRSKPMTEAAYKDEWASKSGFPVIPE